jgi:flagellar hook-basal body complex protein FliE
MNPLDAFSALTQLQAPTAALGSLPTGAMPAGATAPGNAISESFQNLLQAPSATQAGANGLPAGTTNPISEGFQSLLHSLPPSSQATAPLASLGSGGGGASTWGHMVQQMVLDVNSKQETAAQKVSDVLQGGPTPVHEAMAATEEASLSFEFLGEMRNKIVESYQTIMTMQV